MTPFTPTTTRYFGDPDRTQSIEYALTVLDDQCKDFSLEAVSALVSEEYPELWTTYGPSLKDWVQGQLPGADLSEAELRLEWPQNSPTAVLWVYFKAPVTWLKTIDTTCIDFLRSRRLGEFSNALTIEEDWWPVDQIENDGFKTEDGMLDLRYILVTNDEWPDEWS